MAILKTYTISGDFSGNFNHGKFADEVAIDTSVIGFEGVSVDGDNVSVWGDSYTEASLDALVSAHLGESAPVQVTCVNTAIPCTGYIASGTPSIAFFLVSNIIEIDVIGNGTKNIYYEATVPFDCSSATLYVTTWKSGNPTTHSITASINGTNDSVIADYDIEASAADVYEDKSVSFGDSLTEGQKLTLKFLTTNAGGSTTAHRNCYIKFNR